MRSRRAFVPLVVAATMTAAACAEPAGVPFVVPSASPSKGTPDDQLTDEGASARSQIYAAVIRQLVTVDHTFGKAPSPFVRVYVLDGILPEPKRAPWPDDEPARPFPEALKAAIEGQLGDLPPIEFVPDSDPLRPRLATERGAVIGLGPIGTDWSDRRVPGSLECGDVCGIWLSYILSNDDGRWTITDRSGPLAIA